MSTYPLASSMACEDMQFPLSRYGDSPYRFFQPFYEEHIFKDSGSSIQIKTISSSNSIESSPKASRNINYSDSSIQTIDNSSNSKLTKQSKPQKCARNELNPRASKNIKDSGSSIQINNSSRRAKQPSKSKLQKCSSKESNPKVLKKRLYTVNTSRLERPIRVPSITKGEKVNYEPHHSAYHRLDVIHSFMDKLEMDHPSLCTTSVIGKSHEGRDMKILKISNSNASNCAVWIDAGIHAREWIAPATATYLADNIVKNFSTLPKYMTNKDWYFLPVMNPDGYEYTHTKDRMWRKNKAWHKGQFVGVDLNRNFSYGWGGYGSSDEPTNVFYHGPFAFSEPESTAVRDMLLNSDSQFTVYITLHSYGQVILFPFACKEDLCPSYVRLLEGATIMSRAIYNTTGNTYKVGISRDVMYGASGTSNDWSYGVAGIPYCYLLELRSKKHRFKVPSEEIEETGKEIFNCVKALMQFVDSYTPLEIKSNTRKSKESKIIRSKTFRSSISTTKSARSIGSTY